MKANDRKVKVIQHVSGYEYIGGPGTQLRRLLNSEMIKCYDFKVVNQDRPARGFNIPLIIQMAREMRKFHPDIIHVRGLVNEGFHGILAAYIAGCRNIVLSVHGFSEDSSGYTALKKWILYHIIEPITLLLAKKVYCVCEWGTKREIISRYASKKLDIVYNGIEIKTPIERNEKLRTQLGANSTDVVALYVGRITRDKGLFVLADALNSITNPPIMWIAGDGPELNNLRNNLCKLIEIGKVQLLGRRDDIEQLLGACDFFVFPVLQGDNLSNALLEAAHAERAIIATNVGGNSEVVINDVTGKIIPPGDVSVLAEGICAFMESKEMRLKMGRLGRERITNTFSLEKTICKLDVVYKSLME